FGHRRPVAAVLSYAAGQSVNSLLFHSHDCDRSQPTKALTGQRTPKSSAIVSLLFTIYHLLCDLGPGTNEKNSYPDRHCLLISSLQLSARANSVACGKARNRLPAQAVAHL